MSAASPYVRLKLLLAPAGAGTCPSSPSSAASTPYLIKKLEVPRSLPVGRLLSKLASLYSVSAAPGGVQLQVALGVAPAEMEDAVVDTPAKVAALGWKDVRAEDQASWSAAIAGKEKILVRMTPAPAALASSSASSSVDAPLNPVKEQHRPRMPVIAPKAPGPWPRYTPAPGSLPIIILSNEEHEWELLDDEDLPGAAAAEEGWETDEKKPAARKAQAHSSAAAGKLAQAAAANPLAPVGDLVKKPHRVPAAELLAKLNAGRVSSEGLSASAVPTPSASAVTFAVNGSTVTVPNPAPSVKLIEYLRYSAGISGSKIGCGEGGCGACMVVLSHSDPKTGQVRQFATNACLHPLASMDGWAVTTTEGLGSVQQGLHPIQSSMVDNWATQCGYCSPGFVSSMYGLLVNNPKPTAQQVEDAFDGNICRCTGYRPIFKAMRAVVPGLAEEQVAKLKAAGAGSCKCGSGGCGSGAAKADAAASTGCGSSSSGSGCSSGASLTPCGKGEGTSCSSSAKSSCHAVGVTCGFKKGSKPGRNVSSCVDVEDLVLYDPANPKHNPNPFPPQLLEYNHSKARAQAQAQNGPPAPIRWSGDSNSLWIVPQTMTDLFSILSYYVPKGESVKLVAGNTSEGVVKFYPPNAATDFPTVFVPLAEIPQLTAVSVQPDALYVGSAVSLNQLIATLESTMSSLPASSTSSWTPVVRHLKVVANQGVRNVASWCGNMMMAHSHPQFPSDLMTVFSALGGSLQLVSPSGGLRNVNVIDFPGTTLAVDEVVQTLRIPFTPAGFVFDSFKIRARRQNAHPIINAAYALQYQPGAKGPSGMPVIASATLVVGGLSQQGIFVCNKTMSSLIGAELTPDTMKTALELLDREAVAIGRLVPDSTYYIADDGYRHSLVLTTFYKFFLGAYAAAGGNVPAVDQSAYAVYTRPISSGSEVFVPDSKEPSPLGQAIPKIESAIQLTGEAQYIDDAPLPPNGLFGAYVYSNVALATIEKIDASAALAMEGVVRFISAADVAALPGAANDCGSFPGDEEVFASSKITATGQAIGMILADTRLHAEVAAKAVVVTYTNIGTPIVTLADAIAAKAFLPANNYMAPPGAVTRGDFAGAYAKAPLKLEGNNYTGGQAHFSMETQTCTASPRENGALYVQSSSQGPTDIRSMVMRVTGLPANKVVVSTKRAGGGFGSKLSRSHPIASAAALCARITRRPVKIQCSREAELDMWGKRPHMYITYQIGFNQQGQVLALNVTFYQQGGHTYESNFGSMNMCLMWSDNCYFIPNFTVSGQTCRTNTPSNTAMRAPGAMKSVWHIELLMEMVAQATGMSPMAVREANFYTEGQLTPYGQPVVNIALGRVWTQLQSQANYAAAQASAAAFNKANKWRKRGVHISAAKYGISVPGNQMGVLLNVMQDDGTIIFSTTGCEIGQGLNSKVALTIASQLGVDVSIIQFDDNATNIIANGSQTGGSATSESACAAAVNACTELLERLKPFRKSPGQSWADLVAAAAGGLANLTVCGLFNILPPANAPPFSYFVWCAACSQVELDVLTGEVQVLRTDIVYDCGDSLEPSIDIGQIEGAFVMGIGHYLTEEVVYDASSARLLTRGTWDYHPPSSQDIPIALNVTLLDNDPNVEPLAILKSKATAEPPMMLSCSLFFAVRDCIAAVRADQGKQGWFDLPTPASCQTIQLACGITPASLAL